MHGKLYKQLMGSREWRRLRARKLAANPLCERHQAMGKVVAASVVHHIVEVESGASEAECRRLAYSWSNLQSLCRECHKEIHMQRGTWGRGNHHEREQERLGQWASRLRRPDPWKQTPGGRFLSEGGQSSEIT